jgi:hypothetical protein
MMDFLALLLSLLFGIGLITLIVLKVKQHNKVSVVFYVVTAIYFVLLLIFGFYPYEGFTSGLTMVLYYMILYVFCILSYKMVRKSGQSLKWFIAYNLLFLLHLVVDMIEQTNNVFDDMSISTFIYAVLNVILICISLIKRDAIGILIAKITGSVFLILNTIAIIGNGEEIGESIFILLFLYLFVAILGGVIYWAIRKRKLNSSDEGIREEVVKDRLTNQLDDIT